MLSATAARQVAPSADTPRQTVHQRKSFPVPPATADSGFLAAQSHAPPEPFPWEQAESLAGAMTWSFSCCVRASEVLKLLFHALLPSYPPCWFSTSPTVSKNATHPM